MKTDWLERHEKAWQNPIEAERPIVGLIKAWLDYARDYHTRYTFTGVADDGVLGEPWVRIGDNILSLLNGELGRLDGGTLDKLIRETIEKEGGSLE
jgi:hypothetical protein